MPRIEDQILASAGGLNYDDDARLFASGDTDYRLNVIPSALGGEYVLTNLKGTTTKSHSFTHAAAYAAAVYTSLGSCYDVKRNAIYYFIYSDLTNHCILRYNIDDDDFDKIVWDNTKIGLDTDYPINDAYIIDDILFWNPRSSSPRSINVDWAYYDYVAYKSEYARGVTTSTSIHLLVDTPQNFEDSVAVGMVVYNLTDSTSATIVDILSDNVLFFTSHIMVSGESYVIYRATVSVGDYVKDRWCKVYICIQEWTSGELEPSEHTDYFTLVTWCYNDVYSVGSTSAGSPYRERSFFNTPKALSSPLQYAFGTSSAVGGGTADNYIRGKAFQFTYRFYVPELGYTVAAPFTNVVASIQNEAYNGEYLLSEVDNYIQLTANIPSMASDDFAYDFIFEHMEILVRDATLNEWRSIIRIPNREFIIDGETTVTYNFYNDKSGSVADNADIEVPYNYLPITADAQFPIDGVRAGYAGVVEGFDIPSVDVDLTYELVGVEYTPSIAAGILEETIVFTGSVEYDEDQAGDETAYYYYTSSAITTGTYVGDLLIATINGIDYNYIILDADDASDATYAAAISRLINYSPFRSSVTGSTFVQLDDSTDYLSIEVKRYSTTAASYNPAKHSTLKAGAWHSYCLFYYDHLLRRSSAIPLEHMYVNMLGEETYKIGTVTGTGWKRYMDYTINHDAPSWASYWRFGYAGNTTVDEFWQYNIAAAGWIDDSADERNQLSWVDISPLQGITDDGALDINFINSNIEKYTFVEGDRVRFITDDSSATTNADMVIDRWWQGNHDYEITDLDTSTNYIYFSSVVPGDADPTIGDGSGDTEDYNSTGVVIEIYRPKKDSNDLVYYEIGSLSPCTGTGQAKVHSNATGVIKEGDCYLINRTMSTIPNGSGTWESNISPIYVESFSWSDFYGTEIWGKGKAGFAFDIGQKDLNTVRYSNKYIKNTLSSGIGRFDALDYKTLSYNYGDITAGRQVGDVLSILFANNVASILVGATQMFNDDGTSQVLKSDNILGSVNYSEDDYGCVNPESVLVVDRTLYFFDLTRKCYVRKAVNGMFAISDYKMKKYFIDKADELLASGTSNISVYSGWDDDRGLLYVGFNDSVDTDNCEYVLFHEASNRWVAFVDPRNYEETDLFTMPADDRTYDSDPPTLVVLSVATVASETSFISTITVDSSNGCWNDTQSFTSTNTVSFVKGDVVSLSFQLTLDSQSLEGIVYLEATGTGDMPSLNIDMANYASSAYTQTVTITQASTFNFKITIDGNQQVDAPQTAAITWGITVTQKDTPLMVTTPSKLMSFVKENIHLHNDNTTRCNFFGVQKEYTARVYGVASPNIIKIFESIALHTNARFEVTDIQIPVSLNYPNGMQSKLPSGRFEKEEGVLRSDYLCNQKTNQATATIPDLVNGDNLRGYIIQQDLDGDETTEHTLYKIDILSQPSKY